jgi:hypothetical protein
MLIVNVDMQIKPVVDYFKAIQREDQIPEAIKRGLNMLADRFQQRMRERIESSFKIKDSRKKFIFNSIKISKVNRATKTKWNVTISVEYAQLASFEEGQAHTPANGRSLLAAQAGKLTDKIVRGSNALAMRNLTFGSGTIQPHQTGGNRTFSLKSDTGSLMIFQRTGKRTIKPIYRMTSRITRPVKLHFIDTANQIVSNEYQEVFTQAIEQVFKSMRPKK